VLVIDKSGSMEGKPIKHAKTGAANFIKATSSEDFISVIAFDNTVETVSDFSNHKNNLNQAVNGINTGGSTALYDAIAKAFSELIQRKGTKIIVFLTDGRDNQSRYTLSEIRKMNVSEGVFVYGIGLGDVNETSLKALTQATNGYLELTKDSSDLENIYPKILNKYYHKYGNQQRFNGGITIRSLPDSKRVYFNEKDVGNTPFKIDNVSPGNHEVEVLFDRGTATCSFPVKAGYRTVIDLRESDLGKDVMILSNLTGCNVFIDDSYVGTTSYRPVRVNESNFREKLKDRTDQLNIRFLPLGKHIIRIKGIPDFDWGAGQEAVLELFILKEDEDQIYIYAPLMDQNEELWSNTLMIKDLTPKLDPYDELEKQFNQND